MTHAVITFALPEDRTTDFLEIHISTTEDGTYTLDDTIDYKYGITSMDVELDETGWYKISLVSSSTGWSSPLSDPIFGGDFAIRTSPFLAISTTFDGANYASVSELYEISGISQEECAVNVVQRILRSTRAYIDVRLDELNLNSYRFKFSEGVARRKFNGHLRVTRDIEINLAISTIMSKLATDAELELVRRAADPTIPEFEEDTTAAGGDGDIRSVSIGPASATYETDSTRTRRIEHDETKFTQRILTRISVFNEQSIRYQQRAMDLWASIMPNTVDLIFGPASRRRFQRRITVEPIPYNWALNGHQYNTLPM